MKKLSLLLLTLSMMSANALAVDQPGNQPRVRLDTSMGEIVLELYPDKAPKTVDNFLRYVKEGFYNGTIFHRVIRNFMIQGGGFTSTYERKPTHDPIPNEAFNGLKNDRGTIAMARTSMPHSATSQFFINTVNNDSLNFTGKSMRGWGYAVFGKVIKGMSVVDRIQRVATGSGPIAPRDMPQVKVVIKKAEIVQ